MAVGIVTTLYCKEPENVTRPSQRVNTEAHQYTWWSNRGQAWDNNVGWRLDYQVVTPGLKDKVIRTDIYKAERFSDHAPITMDYDW